MIDIERLQEITAELGDEDIVADLMDHIIVSVDYLVCLEAFKEQGKEGLKL